MPGTNYGTEALNQTENCQCHLKIATVCLKAYLTDCYTNESCGYVDSAGITNCL